MMRLGIFLSHPIQYQTPILRELAARVDVHVYYAHRQTASDQARAGFNVGFEWDLDLLSGYSYSFLENSAQQPNVNTFFGCDTPGVSDALRQYKPDVCLINGWYLKSYVQALLACRRLGIPTMVRGDSHLGTERSFSKTILKTLLYPRLLRLFDAALYVGKRNFEYLRRYGFPSHCMHFAPHCVDNSAFTRTALSLDRNAARAAFLQDALATTVLFAGKLLETKRTLDTLEALGCLRSRGYNVQALIAGDGPMKTNLELAAKTLSVPVSWLGFLNQSEMPRAYVMSDVLSLPSSETWGLVVNEALACGTPVVVSDAVGCAPDLVEEGLTGTVHELGDTASLASAIERAMKIPRGNSAIAAKTAAYSVEAAALGVLQAAAQVTDIRSSKIGVKV